jgi:hypothetical protein
MHVCFAKSLLSASQHPTKRGTHQQEKAGSSIAHMFAVHVLALPVLVHADVEPTAGK